MGVEEEFICARENRFLTTEPKFVHLKSPSVNFMTHFTDFIPMLFIKLNCSRSECWVLTLHAQAVPYGVFTRIFSPLSPFKERGNGGTSRSKYEILARLCLHACLCPLHLLTPSVPTCNIHNSAHFSKTIQIRGGNPMF